MTEIKFTLDYNVKYKMLGIEELKKEIEITETTVECPVKDCSEKVERRRNTFKKKIRLYDLLLKRETW